MASIQFNVVSKEPKVSKKVDNNGNESIITEMKPTGSVTYAVEADAEAVQGVTGLFAPPAMTTYQTAKVAGVAAASTTLVLSGIGHGLLGETAQGFVHAIMGAKK